MMLSPFRILSFATLVVFAGAVTPALAEDYSIITFAGGGSAFDGTPGRFNNPYSIAMDSAKNLYVADTVGNTIRKVTPAGVVSTLAGSPGAAGSTDGTGSAARFNFPVGIAVDSSGNIFVADAKNFTIRKITPAGVVTTYAGAPFQLGATDGPAGSARFFLPYGVAVDAAGNVFVADGGNHVIRKISPGGDVSTLAGAALQPGFVNGSGSAARFSTPFDIALDSGGNLYVADSENHAIRRVTSAGVVTTIAGTTTSGATNGTIAEARFNTPRGVSLDNAGNIFVADYGNSTLRLIANGAVSTLAGAANIVGAVDSVGLAARFYDLTDVVADNTTVYIADTSNNTIRKGVPASSAALPVISVQPLDQDVSVGQAVSFRVVASGSGLTYLWLKNGAPIGGATSSTLTIPSAQLDAVGTYSVRISGVGGSIDSTIGTLSVTPPGSGPIIIAARPLSQQVQVGQSATLSITASGSGLTYQWLKNGGAIPGATSGTLVIPSAQVGDAGTYLVRVTSGATVETATAKLIVGTATGAGVSITNQPSNQSVAAGQPAVFSVTATSSAPISYQWFKNDVAINGATGASLMIPSAQTGDAGAYRVRATSSGTVADSSSVTLSVAGSGGPTARLSNLSVRTTMAAGQTLIVGTFVSGGARNILVRAAGPALGAFGLAGAMTDPRLELYNGTTQTFSNDNWPSNLTDTFSSVGAFGFAANSLDAAFVQSIEGGRSIWAQGTGPGVVLVEAYDLGTGNSPRMVNVSARNRVGTGDDILIAGFTIAGTGSKQLLIRAVGPRLGVFGVTGFLVDPILEVYSGSTKLTENDNWSSGLAATFDLVGAFQLDPGSKDAALLTSLPPGSYTVQVRGAAAGTGEGLIEIYEVP